jgi:hypothetical protein
MTCSPRIATLALCTVVALAPFARAQDNYEIQVYGSDTVLPRSTMVEIHSNFTVNGSKTVEDGMLPTNHAEHETLELTQGINDWRASTTGQKLASTSLRAFSRMADGSGWAIISVRAYEFLRSGTGRWA